MKLYLTFFLVFALFSQNLCATASTPASAYEEPPKPAFTPPIDKNQPAFPIEDLIPKPNEQTDRLLSEMLNMLATLGLIIGAILIVAWFLKRLVNTRIEQGNIASSIKILERRNLSPKTVLYLIQVEDKTLLVAESPTGVSSLAQYPSLSENPPEQPTEKIPPAFSKILENKKES